MLRKAAGFTLIETLIAAALIAVVMGLMLPAIQKLREADARAKCTENLKKLGLAAMNYESAAGGLPYSAITKNNNHEPYIPYDKAFVAAPGKIGGTLGRGSGLVPLLHYLGKNDISAIYTFGLDWSDPVNTKALTTEFALFRCPSVPDQDEAVPPYSTTYISGNNAFAPPKEPGSVTNILGGKAYPTVKTTSKGWAADYASFNQVKTIKDANGAETGYANPLVAKAYPAKTIPSPGAMRINGLTKLTEITDGTSNTILYGEAAGRSRQCYAGGVCDAFDSTKAAGPIWADADNRMTLTGTNATGKGEFGKGGCVVNCNNLQGDAYSFHPGGANVCFVDGSVHFVKQSVGIDVLTALITRAGGETINSDSY